MEALIVLLLALVLWTFVPVGARDAARAGLGPLAHALADGVRVVVRGAIRQLARCARWLFGVKELTEDVNDFDAAPTSSFAPSPRSVERTAWPGTVPVEPSPMVPGLVPPHWNGENLTPREIAELLSVLTDAELQAALALTKTDDGDWRFAESRVAKFMPGRVEDRQSEIREVRGAPPKSEPPKREININGRQAVSFD